MRLVFINRFFYPDESATALMLADLVEGLAPLGFPMQVITAKAAYTPEISEVTVAAIMDRLKVTRLPNFPVPHQSLVGRLLNFVAFYCAIVIVGMWHIRRGDIVVCLTDPPLVGVFAALLARLKGAQLVHWVQDIYPETAIKLGYGSQTNPAIRLASDLRDRAWQRAASNVVIGERMADMLASRGLPRNRIRVIQNWADDEDLSPQLPEHNPLRTEWGFSEGDIIVGYSGNLGRAHDAGTMLDAAGLLAARGQDSVRFLFIGGGAKHALLTSAAGDERLAGRILSRPYRPRSELRQSLNIPDIHWLSLEPELEGMIVPSKFYGAAAVGRPIIFVGDTDGEVARLISEADCGASYAKGDAAGVAAYLELLANDHGLRHRLGQNARTYCLDHLSRAQRMTEWRHLIKTLAFGDIPAAP